MTHGGSVFFMPGPEIVQFMRATPERLTSEPDRPITPEEQEAIHKKYPATIRLEQ